MLSTVTLEFMWGLPLTEEGTPSTSTGTQGGNTQIQEKERQSWEATCESLWSEIEASENACLKSEIESAKVKSRFANTSRFDFGATLIHPRICLDILQVNWS